MKKEYDAWQCRVSKEDEFLNELALQEKESNWIQDVPSACLRLEAVESPLIADDIIQRYGLDDDLTHETEEQGTKLLLCDGEKRYLVRDTAKITLLETAKLFGSALSRMSVPVFCETVNNALNVAKGNSLFLVRRGKLSAVHSDSNTGYLTMDQEDLVTTARENMEDKCGQTDFKGGTVSHGMTSCLWTLPEKQEQVIDAYRDALKNAVSRNFALNMMPAARFMTSDTASSCARLIPVFIQNGMEYSLLSGVEVRHSKKAGVNGLSGMDAWNLETSDMYSLFTRSMEQVKALAEITIHNGCNCVVNLCKRYAIPKKYGDAAREMVESMTMGGGMISAHDVFLAMHEAVKEAKSQSASYTTILNLQEAVAKVAAADWGSYDIGGNVCW